MDGWYVLSPLIDFTNRGRETVENKRVQSAQLFNSDNSSVKVSLEELSFKSISFTVHIIVLNCLCR